MSCIRKAVKLTAIAVGIMIIGAALTASAAGHDSRADKHASGRYTQNRINETEKRSGSMKRLITVEEHFISPAINEKIKTIFEERAKKGLKVPPLAYGHIAPGSTELGAERVAHMDALGIDAQIVSYANKIPATLEPDVSVELCRAVNNEMAEKAAAYPGRFYLFAHLPLGDGKEAAKELERCVKELGFAGAMLSGHYHGLPYDDELYFPIFAKAQELDVPIYLHPSILEPSVAKTYYTGPWSDSASLMLAGFGIGWHYDVGMQVVRMMLAGVFDRLPDLKIMIGHWGEVVSFYMYRLDEIPQEHTGLKKNFSDYFKKNIYVNPSGMLYAEQFRYCLSTFGADHITWGEDYPYRRKENIRSFLEEFDLPDADKEKIAHGNIEKLLHIK